jgi:hypothetical protein
MMEAVSYPQTSVSMYHTTRLNFLEDKSYLYCTPWQLEISPINTFARILSYMFEFALISLDVNIIFIVVFFTMLYLLRGKYTRNFILETLWICDADIVCSLWDTHLS